MNAATSLIERYRDAVIRHHPSAAGLPDALLMERSGDLSVYYAPFEYVNPAARIVLVGITPGIQQAENALASAKASLAAGASASEALRIAKGVASFSGPMRANLVRCLDAIGLPQALGIESADTLFSKHTDQVHYTSVLRYPVLYRGENYNRQIAIRRSEFLQRWVSCAFGTEVAPLAHALWIPLGDQPAEVMLKLAEQGHVDRQRVLIGVPHPSGANAERVACFCGAKSPEEASAKTDGHSLVESRERLHAQLQATRQETHSRSALHQARTESSEDGHPRSRSSTEHTSMVTQSAETFLASRFERTALPTKYIAGFRLPNGREIALERNRTQSIYLWTPPLDNVSAQLAQYRTRYAAHKSRNSNLNAKNGPTLREGRPVDYWKLPSVADLESLLGFA
ncbi:hypothetical protein [Aquimonas voraii]|uniref:Uracil DNA glycosylase superfamily protein n=1 Tax=Aquimonas voraii TaxID=265719 RepID=A0A1G6Z1W9_9GAMM|nr:hypothetical protein [Aquimonas voraii]SDD96598.1 Uracil DNA glycosylase superfamily protein [Aquimonas voraii]